MTTGDWAFVVSLCSFFVSLAGFVWNVWSKFIYPRAKVRSNITVMQIVAGDGRPDGGMILLSATNFGPTDITLSGPQARRRQGFLWFRRNRKLAAIFNPTPCPNSDTPVFPKKLAVGEDVDVCFSTEAPKFWVEESDLYYFGFSDTFGRHHWCSRANARKFRADVVDYFGAAEPKKWDCIERLKAEAKELWAKATAHIGRLHQRRE